MKNIELPDYFSITLPELKDFLILADFWNKKPTRHDRPARGIEQKDL